MKNKTQIKEHIAKAADLLKKQVLESEDLKARTFLLMALAIVEDAEDEEAAKSGAV